MPNPSQSMERVFRRSGKGVLFVWRIAFPMNLEP